MAAARNNGIYLQAFFKRIAARRGYLKALVATEHSMLVAVWHMLTNGTTHTDLAGGYFVRLDPQKAVRQTLRKLERLGYTAVLTPIEATA
jgi:transposase